MGVVLELDRVAFGYPRRGPLLEDISFSLETGQALCLLGPNGAGKTTLLRCLLGLHQVQRGQVRLEGQDIAALPRRTLAQRVAYVPQSSVVPFPFQVFDIVLMGRTPHIPVTGVATADDEERARDALARVGALRLLDRSFHEISGGERQLVLIARALCQQARLLVMDEPTANLDYGNQIRVLQIVNALRSSDYAIVMTAHNPDHAFLSATHAGILTGGRLVDFGPPEAVVTSERLTGLYGTAIEVLTAPVAGDSTRTVKACVPVMP